MAHDDGLTSSHAASPGLTSAEAALLLAQHGPNEFRHEEHSSRLRMLARQYASPLVALLVVGAILSLVSGGMADALAILAILVLNGVVGYLQESRAEKALAALRGLTAPRARVLRDGRASVVPAAEIVPGDVLLLEAGDVIAADASLLEANALTTQEAALTGESLPTQKRAGVEPPAAPLAERHGTVFLGTSVATALPPRWCSLPEWRRRWGMSRSSSSPRRAASRRSRGSFPSSGAHSPSREPRSSR